MKTPEEKKKGILHKAAKKAAKHEKLNESKTDNSAEEKSESAAAEKEEGEESFNPAKKYKNLKK